MRPLVKVAVGVVAVAAVIFTAAALYFAVIFDANRYKPALIAASREATGQLPHDRGGRTMSPRPPWGLIAPARRDSA